MNKVCNCCNEEKSIDNFHKHKDSLYGVRGTCKTCISLRKDRKNKQLIKRYGITIEQYNKIFEQQNGRCAICKTHQSNLFTSLAVDHCHTTSKVRGLLCYNCNSGLGRFQDNIELLIEAVTYLNK